MVQTKLGGGCFENNRKIIKEYVIMEILLLTKTDVGRERETENLFGVT